MDYQEANKLANEQHPVRRSGWPKGHHVRHHVEESTAKLKMHTPGNLDSAEWIPDSQDQIAQDWEQYTPQAQEETPENPRRTQHEK